MVGGGCRTSTRASGGGRTAKALGALRPRCWTSGQAHGGGRSAVQPLAQVARTICSAASSAVCSIIFVCRPLATDQQVSDREIPAKGTQERGQAGGRLAAMRGGPSGTSSTSGRVSARTPRQPLGGASAHHSFSSVAAVDGINFVQISRLHKVIEKDEDDDEYDYGSSSGSSSRCNQQQPLASRSRISSSSRGSNNIPLGRLDCQIAAAQWATSGAFRGCRPPRAAVCPHADVGRWRRRPLATALERRNDD